MAWEYDPTDLDPSTEAGRKNIVRLLVGDTDTGDQQLQDEELYFALNAEGDDVYSAAALVARTLASKYSRLVDVELDGQLSESYSQLRENYGYLANDLENEGSSKVASLGVSAGGISYARMETARLNPDRVQPLYRRLSYKYPFIYYPYEYWGEYK